MNGHWLPETPACVQDRTASQSEWMTQAGLPYRLDKAGLPNKASKVDSMPTQVDQAQLPTRQDKAKLPNRLDKAEFPIQADQAQFPTKVHKLVKESADFIKRCRLPTLENGYYIKVIFINI
jgi:hypothetical protein